MKKINRKFSPYSVQTFFFIFVRTYIINEIFESVCRLEFQMKTNLTMYMFYK
jgi:hypothetical protein